MLAMRFSERNLWITANKFETISMNRVTEFNKERITLLFKIWKILFTLSTFIHPLNIHSSKIYIMGESLLSTVQDSGTIIAEKGQKRVRAVKCYIRRKNCHWCSFHCRVFHTSTSLVLSSFDNVPLTKSAVCYVPLKNDFR